MADDYCVSYDIPGRADIEQGTVEITDPHDIPGAISAAIAAQIGDQLGYDVGVQLCNKLGSPLTVRRYCAAADDLGKVVGTAIVNAWE